MMSLVPDAKFHNPEYIYGVHVERVRLRDAPPVDGENLTNIPLYLGNCASYRTYKLLLFTSRKTHTGFTLVPKAVTLNDI